MRRAAFTEARRRRSATALPGITAPYLRPDAQRVYYNRNILFLDEAKAGVSRSKIVASV